MRVALEAGHVIRREVMVGFNAAEGSTSSKVIENLQLHAIANCRLSIDKKVELRGRTVKSTADSLDLINQRIVRCSIEGGAIVSRNNISGCC